MIIYDIVENKKRVKFAKLLSGDGRSAEHRGHTGGIRRNKQ